MIIIDSHTWIIMHNKQLVDVEKNTWNETKLNTQMIITGLSLVYLDHEDTSWECAVLLNKQRQFAAHMDYVIPLHKKKKGPLDNIYIIELG